MFLPMGQDHIHRQWVDEGKKTYNRGEGGLCDVFSTAACNAMVDIGARPIRSASGDAKLDDGVE